jgi:hypothetical protein
MKFGVHIIPWELVFLSLGSIPDRATDGDFSLHYHVQIISGIHPTSCQVDTGDSYTRVKAAGV